MNRFAWAPKLAVGILASAMTTTGVASQQLTRVSRTDITPIPQVRVDSAGQPFGCDGGPGGDFDWVITTGSVVIFDTANAIIIGGPAGVPTYQQTVTNGRVRE